MEIISALKEIISVVVIPLLGILIFYDSKSRKAAAEAKKAEADAKKAEAEAKKVETDNISKFAAEWKELYEEDEKKIKILNDKIDKLYQEKESDRLRMRELMEKNQDMSLNIRTLEVKKCEKRGCKDRIPPSDY